MHLNRVQFIVIAVLIPLGLLLLFLDREDATISDLTTPGAQVMHIDNIPIRVDIANSVAERTAGLSGRSDLGGFNGLLFIFPNPDYHSFWMKDMLFPIDIIWISEDLTVIGIEKGVMPDTFPRTFKPPAPVQYVLETEMHYTDALDIHVGQKVTLPPAALDN